MNSIERGHLEKLCIKGDIDTQEGIDSSLTYWENKKHILDLSIRKEVYDKSECEAVEVKNDKLEWKEFVAKWMEEHPVKEKDVIESYSELCKEVGYPKKKLSDYIELTKSEKVFLSNIVFKRLPLERIPTFKLILKVFPFRFSLKRI